MSRLRLVTLHEERPTSGLQVGGLLNEGVSPAVHPTLCSGETFNPTLTLVHTLHHCYKVNNHSATRGPSQCNLRWESLLACPGCSPGCQHLYPSLILGPQTIITISETCLSLSLSFFCTGYGKAHEDPPRHPCPALVGLTGTPLIVDR